MAENILESYLVQLGATEDTASFVKFHNTLKTAGRAVEGFTTGAVADFIKLEATIVTTFSAFGVGLISLADKTAMADQQFGLMGARMLMTKNSFRAMQSSLDTLGVSLQDVMSDTTGELSNEFQDLYKRNTELGKQLGTTFEASMIGIRRMRIEYRQFGTELEFLSMNVVGKLFQQLGFGTGDALTALRSFNDWFSTQIPAMAQKVTDVLVPAWKDMTGVLTSVGKSAGGVLLSMTNLVGLLSGDTSIESSTLKLENMAKALLHVANGAALLVNKTFGVISTASDLVLYAGYALEAKSEYNASEDSSLPLARRQDAYQNYKKYQALADQNWNSADHESRQLFGIDPPDAAASPSVMGGGAPTSQVPMSVVMANLARRVSAQTGIPANLIYSQWAHETAGFTSNVFKSDLNAGGIRIPGSTEYRKYGSLDQFADSYERTITSSRYTSQGILGAKTDQDFSMALKKGGYYEATQPAYAAGMHRWEGTYPSGDVNIAKIEINMPAHASDERMSKIIHEAMTTHINKTTRNVTAQTAAGAHY